jgi:DNA-binding NtrC family response regulator
MQEKKRLYYLEDNHELRETTAEWMSMHLPDSVHLMSFERLGELKEANRSCAACYIIADLNLPDADPEQVLKFLRNEVHASVPVMIFCGDRHQLSLLNQQTRFQILTKGASIDEFMQQLNLLIAPLNTDKTYQKNG